MCPFLSVYFSYCLHIVFFNSLPSDHFLNRKFHSVNYHLLQWHDERDLIPKCSLSRCISWVYSTCGHLKFMNFTMIPGKHMPHNVQLETENRHSAYYADDDERGGKTKEGSVGT